ncbi:hypothetical protein COL922a_010931, partial [Colletotrichum nupharicola]
KYKPFKNLTNICASINESCNKYAKNVAAAAFNLGYNYVKLSITAPSLKRDMITFTANTIPKINAAINYFTIKSVNTYISLSINAAKVNLSFALYAK